MFHLARKIYVCVKPTEFLNCPICKQALSDFSYWHALWQWDLDNHARLVWFLCGSTISTIYLCSWFPRTFDATHLHYMRPAKSVTSKANPHVRVWCKRLAVHRRRCMWGAPPPCTSMWAPPPIHAMLTQPTLWSGGESRNLPTEMSGQPKESLPFFLFPHLRLLLGGSKQMQVFVRFSTLTGLTTHPTPFLYSMRSKCTRKWDKKRANSFFSHSQESVTIQREQSSLVSYFLSDPGVPGQIYGSECLQLRELLQT